MPKVSSRMKRPAASAAALASVARAKKSLRTKKRTRGSSATTGEKCLAIIAKLRSMKNVPVIAKKLIGRIRIGLSFKDFRRLDDDKAVALLGEALREITIDLLNTVQDCKAAAEGVEDNDKTRQEALAAAGSQLAALRQSAVDCKAALKQATKEIDTQREAIKEAKSAQRSSEAEARKVQDRKRDLEIAQRDAFEPLREAPASGSKGKKRLATLQRTGKAFGFHSGLLKVAGTVFRKQPELRQTFDNDVLQHFAREFKENSSLLDIASQESEQAVVARRNAVELATECVAAAMASRKQRASELANAEQAIVKGQEALSDAGRNVRCYPAHMKSTAKQLERAQLQLVRFCNGPRAVYEKVFGSVSAPAKGSDWSGVEGIDVN